MILLLSLALVAIMLFVRYHWLPRVDPREPPVVSSSVPLIGHIIGLLQYGTRYYQILSAKCKLPIYTLPMLNGKVYVVTSIDLVNAVNRSSKVLAFNPFIAQLGKRITGHDEATSEIVQHNLNGENGPGYVTDIHDGTVSSLAPGTALEDMTETMLSEASNYLQRLKQSDSIDLFTWIRGMVTMCSTRAIYGPNNPFSADDGELASRFWDFDHSLNKLMINIMPSFFAPKGDLARSELGNAFQQYFERYDPKQSQSAAMIETRSFTNTRYGLTTWNQGRLEAGVLIGILANTIPAIFYMIIHVASDPELLRDLRNELETISLQCDSSKRTQVLKVITMRNQCALLNSTFQETLRVHALGSSVRYVREDILLQEEYLLKKGMVVQMPMAVMHADPLAWGSDVNRFEPRRFLKLPDGVKNAFKANATAYRPFGGGASLCPGRHFVTLEAMALTASFILRFDLEPANGNWQIPAQKQESLATNVFPPEKDIRVKIKERRGYEGVTWDHVMA